MDRSENRRMANIPSETRRKFGEEDRAQSKLREPGASAVRACAGQLAVRTMRDEIVELARR